ncbi:hypothetical protein [Actinomadura sp. 6N118]|uniref:hypothetical protein n=1 Tax=Actinomadura sp. 6N118 TaxID=3375151 RepID=UPI0037A5B397
MTTDATPPPMPERWQITVPELSDAFQVEMRRDDSSRGLWWGNQEVGSAERCVGQRWAGIGRDGKSLPNEQADDGLFPDPDAALIRVRDDWRARPVRVSGVFGDDYWIEDRPLAGVASLWLGRIHLGYIRPKMNGMYTAFTTDDRPIHTQDTVNDNVYADQDRGLMAVQHAWRTHLRRILRLPRAHD